MTEYAFLAAEPAETARVAAKVAAVAERAVVGGQPLVVGLSGPLGAGKTTFVQGVVAALDPRGDHYVTSPTYALVQTYDTQPRVAHLDLYRIESLEDLESIGYREIYYDPGGCAFVEWIERVPEAIPDRWLEVRMAPQPSGARSISVRPHGAALCVLCREVLTA